jgi:polyferredoxin
MGNIFSDVVSIVHFAWILFIILAFPIALIYRLKFLRIFHTAALVFTIIMQATGTLCPLTILEEYLRRMGSSDFTYGGSFIVSWLRKLIYIEDLGVSLLVIHILTIFFLTFVFISYIFWPLSKMDRKDG